MATQKKIIYCDIAATTPVRPEVQKEISLHLKATFGNASSIHQLGTKAKQVLEESRKSVADFIQARPTEIVFTSGGTEGNNLAILGLVEKFIAEGFTYKDLHLVTTNIEHSSILEVFKHLENKGCVVDYLPVEQNGCLDPKKLRKVLRPETILVSLAYANSEIGTIEPIIDIAKEIRHARKTSNWKGSEKFFRAPYFHLDASSAALFLPLRTESVGADLITLDAQKIYGPKGAGALYVKTGTPLQSLFFGGKQEAGHRAGTENIPLISGFAKAVELLKKDRDSWATKLAKQRDYLFGQLVKKVSGLVLNGDLEKRLPNNINFSLPGTDSEFVLLQLAERGIICSAKSACLKDETGSYVVAAINNDLAVSQSTLRFTLDRNLTKADLDFIVKVLYKEIIRG